MRTFLRNIIDEDTKNTRKKRKRVHIDNEFAPNEDSAPVNAPNWTKSGYNGTLKKSIENYGDHSQEEDGEESCDMDEKNGDDDEENEENDEENEENTDDKDDEIDDDEVDSNENSDEEEQGKQGKQEEREKRTKSRSRSLVLVRYDSDYDGV